MVDMVYVSVIIEDRNFGPFLLNPTVALRARRSLQVFVMGIYVQVCVIA